MTQPKSTEYNDGYHSKEPKALAFCTSLDTNLHVAYR